MGSINEGAGEMKEGEKGRQQWDAEERMVVIRGKCHHISTNIVV